MNPRQTNIFTGALAVVLAAVAIAIVLIACFMPLDLSAPGVAGSDAHTRSLPGNPLSPAPSLAEFEPLFSRSLRPSLSDRQTTSTTVASESSASSDIAAPSQLTLVGTIGSSLAIIRGPDGVVAVVEVGDDVNGALVTSITSTRVELKLNGRTTLLQKTPDPVDAGGFVTPLK